jgi:ribonuclease BN (tRNA processing enzyme)
LSITVLGCDGSYPGPGGATSGYLLRYGDTNVWLDAGSGTLANLQRHVAIDDLDAVIISHEHPDHWSDLDHLAVAYKWVLGHRGMPVYAPGELSGLLRVSSASEVFDWRRIAEGDNVDIGGMGLSFSRTDHPVTTLAVRVSAGGRRLGYSADSGPGWGLAALGPGLDLALCEATVLSDREGTVPHMSARQAGASARSAGVSRLVITHLWPTIDRDAARAEAEEAFGGPVEVAAIGARYEA